MDSADEDMYKRGLQLSDRLDGEVLQSAVRSAEHLMSIANVRIRIVRATWGSTPLQIETYEYFRKF